MGWYGELVKPADYKSVTLVVKAGPDVSCIIKVPKVADKNGESCISILEKNAAGFLISSRAEPPL
jgi:hypothetical protein